MTSSTFIRARHARGSATLGVTMVLFLAIALVVAYANRAILFEQRSTLNQVRAAQASEAAEAGLDWAVAMLNSPSAVDGACRATKSTDGRSFRDRVLAFDAATGHHLPVHETVAVAACVRSGSGWSCRCAAGDLPPAAAADAGRAAFTVAFERGPQPGSVHLIAAGCTAADANCGANASSGGAAATARVLLALVPGLAAAPAAPLVTRGTVDVGGAALGLHNPHAASGGIVVDAGGPFKATNARLTTAAGASSTLAVRENDAALAASSADAMFARHFGMDRATWAAQGVVRRIDCSGECGAALAAAIDDGVQLLWVDGDLRIDGPRALGSADKPVIVIARGALQLRGAVQLRGVAYAAETAWDDTAGGSAALHGALLSEAGHTGNGAADLHHDPQVFTRLMTTTGSFVRVPGSWRDFR